MNCNEMQDNLHSIDTFIVGTNSLRTDRAGFVSSSVQQHESCKSHSWPECRLTCEKVTLQLWLKMKCIRSPAAAQTLKKRSLKDHDIWWAGHKLTAHHLAGEKQRWYLKSVMVLKPESSSIRLFNLTFKEVLGWRKLPLILKHSTRHSFKLCD